MLRMECGRSKGKWVKAWVLAATPMSAVVTVCTGSQLVRQKRPMCVTEVKTKWSTRRACAVSAQLRCVQSSCESYMMELSETA